MTLALTGSVPAFTLPGTDGHIHSLTDYANATTLVLIQTCNHCPYAQAWEGRIGAIQSDYATRGVRIVAINSNDAVSHPKDSFPEMVARAAAQAYTFDYLYDEDQSVARALGAERTPEVFVFDADRRLVYHGAVDDSRDDTAVTAHYLRDALDAVLAGQAPLPSETPAVGCSVKWRSS
jgi:peroxiredoxin